MNKNFKCKLYFFLWLWFLFVCIYEALAYSIGSISAIIGMFGRAVLDSLAYLWNFGEEMDPFLLILSKIAFFFPLVFLLVLPYFLEKEKQGRSYFYYYNINKENYYLLVDVVTFVAYTIFIIPAVLFSFGILTAFPLFLLTIAFRVYQYKRKLIFDF